MLRKILVILIAAMAFTAICSFFAPEAYAVQKNASTTGAWNVSANWTPTGVPTAGDAVVINDAVTITATQSATCNSLEFANAANGTVTCALVVNSPAILTVTTNIYTASSPLETNHGAIGNYKITGTGTVNCSSVIMHDGSIPTASSSTTFTLSSSISFLNITNNLSLDSTFKSGGAGKTDNQVFSLEAGMVTIGGNITTINQDAANNSSILMNVGAQTGYFELTGATPWNLFGTGINTIRLNGTSTTVDYKGTAAQTILTTASGIVTYTNLRVNNTVGATLQGTTTASSLTIGNETANSIFNDGGYQLTSTGTLTVTSGTFKLGSGTTATSFPAFATRNITAGTTVEYASGVTQTVSSLPAYSNLTFSGGTKTLPTGTVTVGANWIVNGTSDATVNNSNITVAGNISGTREVKMGSGTLSLAGNWTNTGSFGAGTSTVVLNGTSQQTISKAFTGSSSFYNLTLTNSSGADDPGPGVSFTPGIIFSSGVTSTNNYTITTPSVRVQYNSGSTYTFNNINWSGGGSGSMIFFRNSTLGSGTWLLNVSGTQTAVVGVNVARSDASSGSRIIARGCADRGINTNWFFSGAALILD